MDNPVKAQAAITFGEYKKFIYFSYFRRKVYWALLLSGSLVILIVLFIRLLSDPSQSVMKTFSGTMCVVTFIFVVSRVVTTVIGIRKRYDQTFTDYTGVIEFGAESMNAKVVSKGVPAIAEYEYGSFWNVYETQNAFYFYFTNKRAMIVPKGNIFEGTAEELSKLLQEQIGQKLVRYI